MEENYGPLSHVVTRKGIEVSYLKDFDPHTTPQSEPLEGQVPNSAGGFTWKVDDWMQMRRFLILGSEGGTYYITQHKLTKDSADAVLRCIEADGQRAVSEIVSISREGRAPKNDPAIFALALAACYGDRETKTAAFASLPAVCRTGTHLFQFVEFATKFRGWGRGLRLAISNWYEQDPENLAYQLVKYRQRGGWSHLDVIRSAHPKPLTPTHDQLFSWLTGKGDKTLHVPEIIRAYERAQKAKNSGQTVALINAYPKLPWEALNTDHLKDPQVWQALLDQGMPMTALIRNLARMTSIGLLKPMSGASKQVARQLADAEHIRKARVHPLSVLVAMRTYQQGHGERGQMTWEPVSQVVDALDSAFYDAFGNVQATGKRFLLALDVSGSMDTPVAGCPGLSCREASAAMALVTAATEDDYHIMGFSTSFVPLDISPKQRLDDVVRRIRNLPFHGTDCSLPMTWADSRAVPVDMFCVYTDSETWFGRIHPAQALIRYRSSMVPSAKLAVIGMEANPFSIANPDDAGMMDMVGFDTSTPQLIADFAVGAL
jgi:60 kDa SS-A/Ro ribonucleoprotein